MNAPLHQRRMKLMLSYKLHFVNISYWYYLQSKHIIVCHRKPYKLQSTENIYKFIDDKTENCCLSMLTFKLTWVQSLEQLPFKIPLHSGFSINKSNTIQSYVKLLFDGKIKQNQSVKSTIQPARQITFSSPGMQNTTIIRVLRLCGPTLGTLLSLVCRFVYT